MNFIVGKAWPYVFNLPVIAAALLAMSLLMYGSSSRSDVCGSYEDLIEELTTAAWAGDYGVDSAVEKVVRVAKNYSDDSEVQQNGNDLDQIRDESYSDYEVATATTDIAYMCGISLSF